MGEIVIEGETYEVAAKTVGVMEKLEALDKKAQTTPVYKLWPEELEVLLGREAVRQLFHAGKDEDLDRMMLIREQVLSEFNRAQDELAQEKAEKQTRTAQQLLTQLEAVLRQAGKLEPKK